MVAAEDEARFRDLMQAHHYLGALPGMGETVRYVAHHRGPWLALLVFSAPALKCGARDRWIGWEFGVQLDRLHLVTNNFRFLILPGGPRNLGSRVLSLCTRRLVHDWPARFGHPLLLVETFVDPARFHGTVYRAANWVEVERTRGFGRDGCYRTPSLSAIRSLLIRVDPAQLDAALRAWHQAHGGADSALAIDGKTIRGAIDADGNRAHVLGIVGHDTKASCGQENSA